MRNIKKILIIGHFGNNEQLYDGQTVKTRILYEELKKNTNWEIKKVDTYFKSKKPLRLLISSIYNIITNKDIIILLSGNGMKFYFPLCCFFAKTFKKNIYHDVIGGNLHAHVKSNKKYSKYLKSFKVNWVETQLIKNNLHELGIDNVDVIPNFKNLNIIEKKDIEEKNNDIFNFCTFSRVTKEKGITDAINVTSLLNKEGYKCNLDIYGPIDEKYKEELNELIKNNNPFVKYCGVVDFNKSTDVLKKYNLLLFPTYWEGEGFPGTIVDSFSSGLPVVATDWNCNKEIVTNYKTGIIYPNDKEKNLEDAIIRILKDKKLYNQMRNNVLIEAKNYMPKKYIKEIISFIEHN